VGVVGAVGGLEDGQGALLGGAGTGQLAQLLLGDAQVGEGGGDLGVAGWFDCWPSDLGLSSGAW